MQPSRFNGIFTGLTCFRFTRVSPKERIRPLVYRLGIAFSLFMGCVLFSGTWLSIDHFLDKEAFKRFENSLGQNLIQPFSGFHVWQHEQFRRPSKARPWVEKWEELQLERTSSPLPSSKIRTSICPPSNCGYGELVPPPVSEE